MENIGEFFTEVIGSASAAKPRSQQAAVGPSEIGGCRRKVWERLQGTEPTNATLRQPAFLGTAIHAELDRAVERLDPFGERFLREFEVERDGVRGHVDLFDKTDGLILDWKTTKLKSLRYFPSAQQRWQVQVYGYLMSQEYAVKDVALVAIVRDGDETDLQIHREPYDSEIAFQALDWLVEIRESANPPAPEKPVKFCRDWCEFFGACPGKG
jgi:hypothetical protein